MNHRRSLAVVLVTLSSALVVPRVARADDQAEALYQEGRRAAQSKDWVTACAKFRASQDREPAPGTLLNLADCEENRGKLLDALAHFQAAARLFKPGDERGSYASQRAGALDKRIPTLTVRLDPTAPTGASIERDGAPMPAATATRVDPGEHVVVVRAAGRADTRTTVRLAESEARELELNVGAPGAASDAGGAGPVAAPPNEETRATRAGAPAGDADTRGNTMRTLGWVGVGVGVAGLALGTVGGLITLSAKSTVDANCDANGGPCRNGGYDAQDRGKTWSAISTAGFVAGGVGLAAGAALLVLAPKRSASTTVGAAPLPGGALVRVGGTF